MKKKITLMSAVFAFVMLFALTGCGNNASGRTLSATDVYGVGAVSTVKLLGSSVSAEAVSALAEARVAAVASQKDGMSVNGEEAVKAEVDRFNTYFSALDSFLGDDLVTTVTAVNTDENYPYETKLTISGKDALGNTETYVMYYTETQVREYENTQYGKVKTAYTLEGVMVQDGTEYYLEGKRSTEVDRDETESELKIRAYADKENRGDYIEMKQETEEENDGNEIEYVYGVYSDGRLVEETSVKFETERKRGKEQTEYELTFRQGKTKGKYEIDRIVTSSDTKIRVKYDLDGRKGEFTVKEIVTPGGEKQYEYSFSDGSSKTLKSK